MDTFITTLMVIYDNINKEKQEGPRLINNKVTEKQFLAYYIYRIWIKYRKLMEDVNTPTNVRKILKYMEVPKKYHEIYLTYPMADKMPINEKQLDLIILSILKQLNQVYKVYGIRLDGSIPPESKDYKQLNKYLTGKTIENIIQDVMQIKLLVPNLSRPANVRNIWDGIDQMLDDIDVIEPVEYENPETELPDSKLRNNSSNVLSDVSKPLTANRTLNTTSTVSDTITSNIVSNTYSKINNSSGLNTIGQSNVTLKQNKPLLNSTVSVDTNKGLNKNKITNGPINSATPVQVSKSGPNSIQSSNKNASKLASSNKLSSEINSSANGGVSH